MDLLPNAMESGGTEQRFRPKDLHLVQWKVGVTHISIRLRSGHGL